MAPKELKLSDSEKKLFELLKEGKFEEAKEQLDESDVRVNCYDEHGMTPLQQAAYKGDVSLCKSLLMRGAKVNDNNHEHGYTALMFAALSGSTEVTALMLEAGADPDAQNSVNRNAAQMAGFCGQHQCVTVINNFFPKKDLEYYTAPTGLETEGKLPVFLLNPVYQLILKSNLNPVHLSLYLQENPVLLDESYKVARVFDLLVEKMMKQSFTNEVLAMKFQYLACLIRQSEKSRQDNDGSLQVWIKGMLRGEDRLGGFPMKQETFVRSILKDFPYAQSALFMQMIRQLSSTKPGDSPTALSILNQAINGQRMAKDDEVPCDTCGELSAHKKCSACKSVNYCNQACQKLHWFTHKKYCKQLAAEYKEQERLRVEWEKQQAKEAEAKQKMEEAKKLAEESQQTETDKSEETSADTVTDSEVINGDTGKVDTSDADEVSEAASASQIQLEEKSSETALNEDVPSSETEAREQ